MIIFACVLSEFGLNCQLDFWADWENAELIFYSFAVYMLYVISKHFNFNFQARHALKNIQFLKADVLQPEYYTNHWRGGCEWFRFLNSSCSCLIKVSSVKMALQKDVNEFVASCELLTVINYER